MTPYELVAQIKVSGVSLEIRDHAVEQSEMHITQPNYVIGAALTSFPQPSQGLYEVAARDRYTDIGRVVFVPSGVPWRVRTGGGRFRTVTSEFDAETFRSVTGHAGDWSDVELRACHDIRSPRILQALHRLGEEAEAPGFASSVLIEGLGAAMLVDLYRHLRVLPPVERQGTGLDAARIRRVNDYIAALSGVQPTVAALADICGMSSRTFMRRFKATTGQTVGAYVADQQIAKAKLLLRETALPLKEIAFRLGFANPGNFSFAFRRACGQTPRQFRLQ